MRSMNHSYAHHICQTNTLRFQLADLLEEEEDWSGAAHVLMGISVDSGSRYVTIGRVTNRAHYCTKINGR